MKKIFLLSIMVTGLLACSWSQNYYAYDIRIFKKTPAWDLAESIEGHDSADIVEFINEHPDLVDYKERKFGYTPLCWTFFNSRYIDEDNNYYNEAKLLIQKGGANPFYILPRDETSFGISFETPLMKAANIMLNSAKYIRLCLESKQAKQLSDSMKRVFYSQALIVAAGKNKEELEGVKVLVEAGADINYYPDDSMSTPVSESITHENMQVAKYLIIEKGAKYDIYRKRMVDDVKISVLERIKNKNFETEPDKEKIRQEILAYIEAQKKQ